MRSPFHRGLAGCDHCAPKPIQTVEQKQPRRAHERLRLGHPNLGAMALPKHLCGPLGRFRTGNLTESLDCGSRDPQRHRAKAGDDAGKRRETIARLGQNMRVVEP